jgi:hypothetical protein
VDVRDQGGSSGEAKAWNNGAEDDGARENGEAIDSAQVRRRPVGEVGGKVAGAAHVSKEGREARDQEDRFAQDRGEARGHGAAEDRAAQECRTCRSIEEARRC